MDEKNQKNQMLELIRNTRTIRACNPKSLSQNENDIIIHGVMRAPIMGHIILDPIIQLRDQKIKDKLINSLFQFSFLKNI